MDGLQNYHVLFEQATDAIMVTDYKGNFVDVNSSLSTMFGYTKEELLRMNVHDLLEPEHVKETPIRFDLLAVGHNIFNERRMMHRDGTIVHVESNAKRLCDNRILAIARNITEKKKVEDILRSQLMEQKMQEQRRIVRAVINTQEIERNKIGQELHDNVNQILSSARLYLDIIENDKEKRPDIIARAAEFIDMAIHEIRHLSKAQVTPEKAFNLKLLIEELLSDLNEGAGKGVKFQCRIPSHLVIDEDLKLNIYRIIQEQTCNILKYARAKNAVITIKQNSASVYLSICDDGKGFDLQAKRKGIGLTNIINRIESYNGAIHIDTAPGKGCSMHITIPSL
jgi:PAS domain S-box-containing protein